MITSKADFIVFFLPFSSQIAPVLTKSSSVIDVHKSRLPTYSSSDRVNLRKTSVSNFIPRSQRNDNNINKLINGQTLTHFNHTPRSQSHRENLNGIVERGLTTKRREELINMLVSEYKYSLTYGYCSFILFWKKNLLFIIKCFYLRLILSTISDFK